jgi:hypothetical protein
MKKKKRKIKKFTEFTKISDKPYSFVPLTNSQSPAPTSNINIKVTQLS